MSRDTENASAAEPASKRRDDLALVRTDLANERTLLAYGRTALMVAATGLTVIKFFPELLGSLAIGWSLGGLAMLIALFGLLRFSRLRRRLRRP